MHCHAGGALHERLDDHGCKLLGFGVEQRFHIGERALGDIASRFAFAGLTRIG